MIIAVAGGFRGVSPHQRMRRGHGNDRPADRPAVLSACEPADWAGRSKALSADEGASAAMTSKHPENRRRLHQQPSTHVQADLPNFFYYWCYKSSGDHRPT